MSYYTGDYYMSGSFFGKLRRLGKKAVKGVGKLSKFAGKVAPIATMVNPALGMAISSVSQQVGRVSQMLSPSAAPSGMPMEGSPPAASLYQASTQGGQDDPYAELRLYLLLTGRI